MADAVVIGSGPNGLVAANLLADEGWDVEVLEAADSPGGAVRSAEVTAPGYQSDLYSAFYPLGYASPVIRDLGLERYGLRWVNAPAVVAHPTPGGPTAMLEHSLDATAESMERFAPGDGDAWRALYETYQTAGERFVDMLMSPVPPIRPAVALARRLGASRLLPFSRQMLMSVRRLGEERFAGEGGRLLLTGNACHADIAPEGATSAIFGWLLCGAGQDIGFPVPERGAGELTMSMVRRLEARGGRVRCGQRVTGIEVQGGRAVSVRTAAGDVVPVRRAVLADVDAVSLYAQLLDPAVLPAGLSTFIQRTFHRGPGTFKLDWALSAPIPWKDEEVGRAGTVHLADSVDEMTMTFAKLAAGLVPDEPLCLLGQMTTTDPTRSPAGTESAWSYSHVPIEVRGDAGPDGITGSWDEREIEAYAERMEARVEALAPGFRDLIVARHVASPKRLQADNANLVLGDVAGGTQNLHQQLVFRPVPGLARPETPIRGLYLASASAHPGGAVHGACGSNAAIAAIAAERPFRHPVQALTGQAARRVGQKVPPA